MRKTSVDAVAYNTPKLEIEGPKGEWPLHGLYWSAPAFKVIFETSDSVAICYWSEEDFGVSKMHREDSRRYVKSITFDTEKKTYTVKKKSWWKFWKWKGRHRQLRSSR